MFKPFLILVTAGLLFVSTTAQAQSPRLDSLRAAGVPENLIAFEAVRHQIPDMQVGGVPLGGLSVCKLRKRGRTLSQPFYALPRDVGEETCDLSQVLVAWKGWCDSGVRDATGGVHFSQSFLPSVTIEQYGAWTVVRFNNYLKTGAQPTAEDDAAALAYFQDLPATHDTRGADVEIFPTVYVRDNLLPLGPHAQKTAPESPSVSAPGVRVPTTDEEARRLLERHNPRTTDILRNLYAVYRAKGHDVLTAYSKTLKAHIEAFELRDSLKPVKP
jgi:hypothetical protein